MPCLKRLSKRDENGNKVSVKKVGKVSFDTKLNKEYETELRKLRIFKKDEDGHKHYVFHKIVSEKVGRSTYEEPVEEKVEEPVEEKIEEKVEDRFATETLWCIPPSSALSVGEKVDVIVEGYKAVLNKIRRTIELPVITAERKEQLSHKYNILEEELKNLLLSKNII